MPAMKVHEQKRKQNATTLHDTYYPASGQHRKRNTNETVESVQ